MVRVINTSLQNMHESLYKTFNTMIINPIMSLSFLPPTPLISFFFKFPTRPRRDIVIATVALGIVVNRFGRGMVNDQGRMSSYLALVRVVYFDVIMAK